MKMCEIIETALNTFQIIYKNQKYRHMAVIRFEAIQLLKKSKRFCKKAKHLEYT